MKTHLRDAISKEVPQSEPIFGRSDMVKNNAGGYGFSVPVQDRLMRFLILGTEGGTYYVRERELTRENAEVVLQAMDEDYHEAIDAIEQVSLAGRAPSNQNAIFALALACSYGLRGLGNPRDANYSESARSYAFLMISAVCRTGTHLYSFASYCKELRGWGPGFKKAIQKWYLYKPLDKLAYQMVKYRQRDGWKHRDLLRLAHPKPHLRSKRRSWSV